jgi:hypothetical protein
MPGLHELNVSLTKNGYFKVADVIEKHPRHEVLNNIRGTYVGINLDRAQIANMLSADSNTRELPEEWDEIRSYSKRAIDALVFISILFSHHTFITVFAKSMTAEMRGVLQREDRYCWRTHARNPCSQAPRLCLPGAHSVFRRQSGET